ncbi:MFS transporter [Sandaracinus amylolyticus]|uniref:MFS transporter n=1 Tax=Sandaracinus amylolyticus TaxID=927083 RepID=UPI001F3A4FD6|nr:MFS transporter [Sandaracinus amylolyticus]
MSTGPATALRLRDFSSPPMRAFHVTWIAFFLCFFAWFATAPLLPLAREALALTQAQMDALLVASLATTIVARPVVGWICDRVGPRRTYTALLVIAAVPLLCMPLVDRYEILLALRLLNGLAGASFVVTSVHTARMFAPNCVGTASATAAGWGNLGGGVAHLVMPSLLGLVIALGADEAWGWRYATLIPGVALLAWSLVYFTFTQDLPEGDQLALTREGKYVRPPPKALLALGRDPRVWLLALQYGACFGVEIALENAATLFFRDRFALSLATAGVVAGCFGGVNIFARALGGWLGDRAGGRAGLRGRLALLAIVLTVEGAALVRLSTLQSVEGAVVVFVSIGLFVAMGAGATYAAVPLLHPKTMGAVSGWVGAGGNLGAVAAAVALGSGRMLDGSAFLTIGIGTIALAALTPIVIAIDSKATVPESEPMPLPVPADDVAE